MAMPVRKEKLWYRARGCQTNGICHEWEGTIMVPHISLGIGMVKQLSTSWNMRDLYYIALYEYDDNTGEMKRVPLIWQSYNEDNEPLPTLPMKQSLILPSNEPIGRQSTSSTYTAPTKKVMNTYDDADWCEEFDVPANFLTLKLKEQESDKANNDRV